MDIKLSTANDMKTDNKNNQSNDTKSRDETRRVSEQLCKSRLSFRAALCRARKQAGIDGWDPSVRQQVDELCKIVALIYVLPDDNMVCVGGEVYPASIVSEVFEELTAEHFDIVMTKFAAVKNPVANKRAYLTTALFNSVFELEADAVNKLGYLWPFSR